jgi:hypothetical protein
MCQLLFHVFSLVERNLEKLFNRSRVVRNFLLSQIIIGGIRRNFVGMWRQNKQVGAPTVPSAVFGGSIEFEDC